MTTAPGWYYADGDPPQTQRYWDGSQWVGQPVYNQSQPGAPQQAAPQHPGQGLGGQPPQQGTFRRVAEPGTRIGARIIDVLIVFGFLIALVITDVGGTPDSTLIDNSDFSFNIGNNAYDTRLEFVIFALFGFVWHVAWVHFKGGTPGKLMLGLRIADEASGQMPVELQQAAIRSSVYMLPFLGLASSGLGDLGQLASFLIGLVSLIMLFADQRHRTVMDRLAKTIVVNN